MLDRILKRTIDFLSSFSLAVIVILLLLLLTFLGTLEQVDRGLFDVQREYFESIFLVHWVGGKIPILLPGVYLLMVVLTVNLVLGGIVRMKRSWSRLGIYITHIGILLLIFTSFRSYRESVHGGVTLFEGEETTEFASDYDWEIAIWPAGGTGPVTERKIPNADLADLAPSETRTFTSDELPFDLTVSNWIPHCQPFPAPPGRDGSSAVLLRPLPAQKNAEANTAGAYAEVRWKGSGRTERGILWSGARQASPMVVVGDGGKWAIDLRKTRMNLGFRLKLDEFYHEFHPGTGKPKVFRSVVTKTSKGGTEQTARIEMNEPLRSGGITVYQSNWGPQGGPPGQPLFSGFSVVRNPVDQWPLWCTVVISIGLLLHFGRKLWLYLRMEAGRRA